ncbi:ABC transporter ATP-binding protein [Paenibacillus chartarius]|uniref:ABC transporter ATP-binding protein n=1 Tax=Paenibacillus chartarius TaxID=747481 RepID=A0ABV6DTN1_9BACL
MSIRRDRPADPSPMPGHRGPMMPPEKPKDFKGTLRRLTRYLKPRQGALLVVLITALLSTLFNVISPKLLGDATSSIFESFVNRTGIHYAYLLRLTLILGGLYLLSSLFSFIQQYIMTSVSQSTVAELRSEVQDKLSRLPIQYFDRHPHGDLLSRAVNDVDNISNAMQQGISQLITSTITVLGIIVMMLVISPLLTLVTLITIPLSLLVVKRVAKYSQKHFVNQQKELGAVNGHIEEMFSGHQVVKAFGQERKSIEAFDKMNERLYEAGWKAQFISGVMMPLTQFVGNLGFVLVSIAGGIMVLMGYIRIGDVQAFIQYSQQMTWPMSQMASVSSLLQTALASAERIFVLLDEPEELRQEAAPIDLNALGSSIEFERVRFGYKPNEPVIRGLSVAVKEGQTVAIVGPTGAGKSTIINLLMRFYDVGEGRISIDGVDLRDLSREQVRSMFAMVLQDTWLFHGTIRDNIAYGREGATEADIVEAARQAHADDFIRTLPDGYDTLLTEDATNISQGQRQLITIARAIISEPKILILDEATSSVDTRTEMQIQRAMGSLMKGHTCFVIAHRLSTIQDADVILVMNQGDIIEMGSHQELLRQNGFYADLYKSQFAS